MVVYIKNVRQIGKAQFGESEIRDPKRIDEILELISKIWHKNPDLRLIQLIENCFPEMVDEYGIRDTDLYYIEDNELQDRLEKKYL